MDMRIYLSILAALATLAGACLTGALAFPLLKPIAWALIIGIATIPHHKKILSRIPNRPNTAAFLMVLMVTLCLILPATALILTIATNATDWLKESEQLVQSLSDSHKTSLSDVPLLQRVVRLVGRVGIDITGYAAKFASAASQYLVDAATSAAKNLASLIFTLMMTLFILFFIYRDGKKIATEGAALFPVNQEKTLFYLYEIQSTTSAVIVGTLLTCVVQGGLAGLGYFVAGIPLSILWGILTALAGLLPVLGTAAVWAPLAVFLGFQGDYLKATLLALWGAVVVIGITDTMIRPLFVTAKARKIPTLAVVLGAIGGVMTVGVLGLFLGPIVFGVLVTVWRDVTGTERSHDSYGEDI